MAVRKWGVINAPGTTVVEKEGVPRLTEGLIGGAAFVGAVQKGPVGEMIPVFSWRDYMMKCGGIIPDTYVPDSVKGYYNESEGYGAAFVLRVTDGHEMSAYLDLYDKTGTTVLRVTAKSPGAWAGHRHRVPQTGSVAVADPTTAPTVTLKAEAGSIDAGTHSWKLVWITASGSTLPSPKSSVLTSVPADHGKVDIVVPTLPDNATGANIYRTVAGDTGDWKLVNATPILAASTYTDNIADASLGAVAPTTNGTGLVKVSGTPSGNHVTLTYRGGDDLPQGFWQGGKLKKISDGSLYDIMSEEASKVVVVRDATGLAASDECELLQYNPNYLSVLVRESPQDPDRWNLYAFENGILVTAYENLTLDPDDAKFCEKVINNDDSNYWFTVTSMYSGLDYTNFRPYNEYGAVDADSVGSVVIITGATAANQNDLTMVLSDYVGGTLRSATTATKRGRINKAELDGTDIKLTLDGEWSDAAWTSAEVVWIEFDSQLNYGYDGDITDLSARIYTALQVGTTALRTLNGNKRNLIKVCTPGYGGDADIAKAGINLAETFNFQYRVEPDSNDTPESFKTWVEEDVGRSDFAVANYPGWMLIREGEDLKTIPVVGDVLGEEARIAVTYGGYFKAEAGTDAVLSRCLGYVVSTNKDYELEDYHIEFLNPAGINCLVHKFGNAVIWGDRTLASTTVWRWKHMREQMSHYEHILLDGYDWIIFAINNPDIWPLVYVTLEDYFVRQWKIGAIYSISGKFEDACRIIVDKTNNTDASIDQGILNADVSLKFSGCVERFIISIGRMAVTEKAVAA